MRFQDGAQPVLAKNRTCEDARCAYSIYTVFPRFSLFVFPSVPFLSRFLQSPLRAREFIISLEFIITR